MLQKYGILKILKSVTYGTSVLTSYISNDIYFKVWLVKYGSGLLLMVVGIIFISRMIKKIW